MIFTNFLSETDEQTYFDLSPLGVSRDPRYGGPSTSSDVPVTRVSCAARRHRG